MRPNRAGGVGAQQHAVPHPRARLSQRSMVRSLWCRGLVLPMLSESHIRFFVSSYPAHCLNLAACASTLFVWSHRLRLLSSVVHPHSQFYFHNPHPLSAVASRPSHPPSLHPSTGTPPSLAPSLLTRFQLFLSLSLPPCLSVSLSLSLSRSP